ncbi:MAG: ABC transporter permease subunit [Candidatus Thermoplasmatota archaeon]
MGLDSIVSIAKKEIMDNIRNKWVIIITIIFTSLTLLASYAGSIFGSGWQDLSGTISTMSTLVQYLVSIIALVLGYSAIIGEIEKGSMSSLIALPTNRKEILFGKFIGLGTILAIAVLIGFGLAGIIISFNVGNVNYGEYLFFIGSSIFMGLIFLNIGLLLSTLFNKRSTAMGSAIFVWVLFAIIWIFITSAIVVASGTVQAGTTNPASIELPVAYWASNFFNPLSSYSSFVSLNIESIQNTMVSAYGELGITPPLYFNSTNMLISMIIWFIAPLLIAFWRFGNKDI